MRNANMSYTLPYKFADSPASTMAMSQASNFEDKYFNIESKTHNF